MLERGGEIGRWGDRGSQVANYRLPIAPTKNVGLCHSHSVEPITDYPLATNHQPLMGEEPRTNDEPTTQQTITLLPFPYLPFSLCY